MTLAEPSLGNLACLLARAGQLRRPVTGFAAKPKMYGGRCLRMCSIQHLTFAWPALPSSETDRLEAV